MATPLKIPCSILNIDKTNNALKQKSFIISVKQESTDFLLVITKKVLKILLKLHLL